MTCEEMMRAEFYQQGTPDVIWFTISTSSRPHDSTPSTGLHGVISGVLMRMKIQQYSTNMKGNKCLMTRRMWQKHAEDYRSIQMQSYWTVRSSDGQMGWHFWLSDKTVLKFAELPIYCQRQKYSAGILVSSKASFMRILSGFAGEGRQMRVVWSKMAIICFFRSIYLPNLHTQGHNTVLCSHLVALQ